jgi:hypothetical protein
VEGVEVLERFPHYTVERVELLEAFLTTPSRAWSYWRLLSLHRGWRGGDARSGNGRTAG